MPETWEIDEDKHSAKLHTGYTGISAWFIKSLAGIEPVNENPAYKTVNIRPRPAGELRYAGAGVETPYGLVESRWTKENGKIHFEISVPVNVKANIVLPDGQTHSAGAGKYNFTIDE
jgi:alpha-L-rhamnosidase